MQFYSFDIQDFMTAIENKDYSRIKACIVNAILNNPTFAKNQNSEPCYAKNHDIQKEAFIDYGLEIVE